MAVDAPPEDNVKDTLRLARYVHVLERGRRLPVGINRAKEKAVGFREAQRA